MGRRWTLPRSLKWYYLAPPLFVLGDLYVSAPIRVAGAPRTGPFDRIGALNFLLSGTVFIFAFHRSQASLVDGRRRSRRE